MCRLPDEMAALLDEAMESLGNELATIDILSLPSVPISGEKFAEQLPTHTSGVYFLVHQGRDVKYLGKASNLRSRWLFTGNQFFKREPRDVHHCLELALEVGEVSLHYWAIPKKYISIVEILLLRALHPPWNTHDVARD